jgi:hypothetical protein
LVQPEFQPRPLTADGADRADHRRFSCLYPHPRDEAIRFRTATLAPGEDFERCGFELPPPPAARDADAAQIEMFAEHDAQPDAADGEPVFWTAPGGEPYPDDTIIQADAPD